MSSVQLYIPAGRPPRHSFARGVAASGIDWKFKQLGFLLSETFERFVAASSWVFRLRLSRLGTAQLSLNQGKRYENVISVVSSCLGLISGLLSLCSDSGEW